MEDYLKQQFFQQKIDDLLKNNIKLLPTIICERDSHKGMFWDICGAVSSLILSYLVCP